MDKVHIVCLEQNHNTGAWGDCSWSSFRVLAVFHEESKARAFIETNAKATDYYGERVECEFKWAENSYVGMVPNSDKYPNEDFEEFVYSIVSKDVM